LTALKPWHHPVLLARKAIGKLQRRLVTIPGRPTVRKINGSVSFEFERLGFLDEGDLRAMLTGSYDIILCDYLKKHVRAGDIVLDVGANVGYISAVAASFAGPAGEVHGFEPLAECYVRLQRLSELNPEFHFTFNNVALGESEGFLPIAFNPDGDSRNATLVPGKDYPQSRQVRVRRLDDYIAETVKAPQRISLIKIDVEGFEFSVLKGLSRFLAEFKPVIVCEIKPWEVRNLGATLDDFAGYIKGFGYSTYVIGEEETPVELTALADMEVIVFRH
jgi:FkbM family methyltransferase